MKKFYRRVKKNHFFLVLFMTNDVTGAPSNNNPTANGPKKGVTVAKTIYLSIASLGVGLASERLLKKTRRHTVRRRRFFFFSSVLAGYYRAEEEENYYRGVDELKKKERRAATAQPPGAK